MINEKCPECGNTTFWNASGREETHWHCQRCDTKFIKASFLKEQKEMFEKHGFEVPNFECEILKKYDENIVGAIFNKEIQKWIGITWNSNGNVIIGLKEYSLNLIEKKWYEEIKNFPCIMFSKKYLKSFIAIGYKNNKFFTADNLLFNKESSIKLENEELNEFFKNKFNE